MTENLDGSVSLFGRKVSNLRFAEDKFNDGLERHLLELKDQNKQEQCRSH